MKRCLVLGAGGFLGKSICNMLSKNNIVVAYDRRYTPELDMLNNTTQIIGDFVNTEDFSDILVDIDVVIHLISTTIPSEDTSCIKKEIQDNIIPTVCLLESMVKCNVKEIIFASSGGTIYGESGDTRKTIDSSLNPICSYGVQKKVIESYLQFYGMRYGINYKIARITNPYGIGQDVEKPQGVIPIFIRKLLNEEEITIYGDGMDVRDYIYMDDLMNALEKILLYNGEMHIFNVGTGEVYSLHEIINKISVCMGKVFKNIVYKPKRKCDLHKSILEVETTWDALGYRPHISIDEGIRLLMNVFEK